MMTAWPDLGALVEKFGSYSGITPEAWAEFDQANVVAQSAYRRNLPMAETKKPKPPKKP